MNADVKRMFIDAEKLYNEAIEELNQGKIRNTSEKAWCATLLATNALILARIGKLLSGAKETTKELHKLAISDKEIDEKIVGRYHTQRDFLHGDCFYAGITEPNEVIERRIKETIYFINDAKELAEK